MGKSILLVSLLSLLACSSSSSSSGADGGATSGGTGGGGGGSAWHASGDPNKCPDLLACVKTSCTAEATQCYGANFASGNPSGGDCGALTSCTKNCPCDANYDSCTTKCALDNIAVGNCRTCATTYGTCVESHCQAQSDACEALSSSTTGSGGATGTGGAAGTGGATGTGGTGGSTGTGGTGGSTNTGGSGGTGGMPTSCGTDAADDACTGCLKGHCCTEITACAASPSCSALIACSEACSDQTCIQTCVTNNVSGVTAFTPLYTCEAQSCSTQCN